MSGKLALRRKFSGQRGFTLLELLVVISILAAVAFIATGTFSGVREQANDQLVRAEMQEIARAIRQFRQDTGYYPGEGPFALSSVAANSGPDCPGMPAGDGGVDRDYLPSGAGVDWFESPANFWQLFVQPVLCDNHPLAWLASWDPDSGRGWRGPYIEGFAEGFVDISNDINLSQNGESGSPVETSPPSIHIQDVQGIADPFEYRAEPVSGNTLLDWNAVYLSTNEREVWGRPYLYLQVGGVRSLVSMGANGEYNQAVAGTDDIVLNIE